MGLQTGVVDGFLHLAMFIVGGATVALVALTLIDASGEGSIPRRYAWLSGGAFVGLLVIERAFHALS